MQKICWAIVQLSGEDSSKPITDSILHKSTTLPLRVIPPITTSVRNTMNIGGVSTQKTITRVKTSAVPNKKIIMSLLEDSSYSVIRYEGDIGYYQDKRTGKVTIEEKVNFIQYKVQGYDVGDRFIVLNLFEVTKNENISQIYN